jgi:hypothetical protein
MKKKKINVEMMDKVMSTESLRDLVKATARAIEEKVKGGVKFEQAKREVFEELDSIIQIVKKLSLARYNSRAFLEEKESNRLFGSIIEPYLIGVALMGGILVLFSLIIKLWKS